MAVLDRLGRVRPVRRLVTHHYSLAASGRREVEHKAHLKRVAEEQKRTVPKQRFAIKSIRHERDTVSAKAAAKVDVKSVLSRVNRNARER